MSQMSPAALVEAPGQRSLIADAALRDELWADRVTRVRPGDAVAAVHHLVEEPGLLQMVAQPLVDLQSGNAAGYELLARAPAAWAVPPDVLFAVARAHGVSAILHERVVSEAIRLRSSLPDNTFLTVNVDPPDLADARVRDVLFSADSLSRVVVEVTEHEWPAERGPIDNTIAGIREAGGMIAADDVGAGYAGLNQLMRLRPHFVKIDRELIENLGHDPAAEALVAAVGQLSGSLDSWVIVEGVETEVQLAALNRLNVPLGQGWLLGRPADPWSTPPDVGMIQRQHAAQQVKDTIHSLLRTVSQLYTRNEHGQYWRPDSTQPVLTIAPTTTLGDAVQRALARPATTRWTPILVTHADGRIAGEVTLEDLVSAVARQSSS